jgi:H+/Cl- antiporter ClcA
MTASHTSDVPLSERLCSPASLLPQLIISNPLKFSPETVVLLLAVLIGTGTGLGVVVFHLLIEGIHDWVFEDLLGVVTPWGAWTLAGVPTLGGLIVGLMRWRWQDFGPSMASLATLARGLQDLSPLRPVIKMLAAAVSLGTGASLGPEGPSVEIGAYFGTCLGQILQVSQERQRLLLGAGAAAGLAAGFNAPIAGVFLALEVVMGSTFVASAASVVLLAAVLAAFVAQLGLGGKPAFTLPAYEVKSLWELPLYIGLGLLACLVSITFSEAIQLARKFFHGQIVGFSGMRKIPLPLQPVIGGACVGLVALKWPQIMGIGYETVESMLQGVQFSLQLLLILLAIKLVMTAVSLGSGLVGGVFAPALFLGASLGAAYGQVLAVFLPGMGINIAAPPAYAMVGMAAVLAGSARAPLTAILLLFELTRDYRIVLPLMAAVGLSAWLVERFKPAAPQPSSLKGLGLNLAKNPDPELLKRITVSEAMHRNPLRLPSIFSILEAGRTLMNSHVHTGIVVDLADNLLGLVTLNDIGRMIASLEEGAGFAEGQDYLAGIYVSDICTKAVVFTYADESLSEASARMATRGLHQLPVVDRENPQRVIGLLTQEAIDLASSTAITCETLRKYLATSTMAELMPLPISLSK